MRQETLSDQTLPSVAALSGRYATKPLVCTVVFHPQTRRIGERLEVPARFKGGPLVVGRNGPGFGRIGVATRSSLQDRHVSRRALLLSWQGNKLCIERPVGASRVQIAGKELRGEVQLTPEQLARGVPLLLAHTVVLLLRFDHVALDNASDDELGLQGCSNYLANVRSEILRAAQYDQDLLIRGETGSGKELVASAVHANSERARKPLVAVNMAAVPAELAAAALFGNTKGAYTGADQAREGYFLQADGGTLFLDEVGDTPPGVQAQLLRVLQQREIQPVGGTVRPVSTRVISATDAPLEEGGSNFKSALRHRLGSLEIRLLPLREHPEDIGVLILHFLSNDGASKANGVNLPGEQSSQMEIARWADLFHQFLSYSWPGNVRELANHCRQVLATGDAGISVPESIRAALEASRQQGSNDVSSAKKRSMHDVDEGKFDIAWEQCRYEPAATARLLGVSRQSVYRRVDQSARYRLAGEIESFELRRVLGECGNDSVRTARQLRVSLSALRAVLRGSGLEWR